MPSRLHREQIYDAAFDDGLFANLSSTLSEAYDARSCTVHWRHFDGSAQIMSHSGHFSDDQMLNYATNFTGSDLWTLEALRPSRANQVLNCDQLVSPSAYEKSAFYNDWIRAMGDDTFHCMGIVMRTRWGAGIIGLHRGRTQGSFSDKAVQALKEDIADLCRMLVIRGRLTTADAEAKHKDAILNTIGEALIAVGAEGQLVSANRAAETLLERQDCLTVRRGKLVSFDAAADRELRRAIGLVASQCQANAVPIPCRGGGTYELSIVPFRNGHDPQQVLITIRDGRVKDGTLLRRLRALHGLTEAEAEVAVRIAEGESPAMIAEERQVSVDTVRAQLKSVFRKLGCTRQSELVASVKSLPQVFPG